MIDTRRMTVEGIATSVHIGGPGRTGPAGPGLTEAVVFVHGNPDSGSDWMPLVTRVARYATVVAPDLPGFGSAAARPAAGYTIYSYARFLHGVIGNSGSNGCIWWRTTSVVRSPPRRGRRTTRTRWPA